jgi:hypothetical protein
MFDGKYNPLLDSSGFRFGTLALGLVIWAGTVVGLLAAA